MLQYNEKSGVEFVAEFFDATGTPTLPTTVHYRLDCVTTDTTLRDWTSLTPITSTDSNGTTHYTVEVVIPGSLNALQRSNNRREVKQILFAANKDAEGEYSEPFQYYVSKVHGRS